MTFRRTKGLMAALVISMTFRRTKILWRGCVKIDYIVVNMKSIVISMGLMTAWVRNASRSSQSNMLGPCWQKAVPWRTKCWTLPWFVGLCGRNCNCHPWWELWFWISIQQCGVSFYSCVAARSCWVCIMAMTIISRAWQNKRLVISCVSRDITARRCQCLSIVPVLGAQFHHLLGWSKPFGALKISICQKFQCCRVSLQFLGRGTMYQDLKMLVAWT